MSLPRADRNGGERDRENEHEIVEQKLNGSEKDEEQSVCRSSRRRENHLRSETKGQRNQHAAESVAAQRCSPRQKSGVQTDQCQKNQRRSFAYHSRVDPRHAKKRDADGEAKCAQRAVVRSKQICESANRQRKRRRKRFVLKIRENVGDGWHTGELQRAAFIPPKRAGMLRADDQKEQNDEREKDRDDPFGAFYNFDAHFLATFVRGKEHVDLASESFLLFSAKWQLRGL